jgi:hypothetical protein
MFNFNIDVTAGDLAFMALSGMLVFYLANRFYNYVRSWYNWIRCEYYGFRNEFYSLSRNLNEMTYDVRRGVNEINSGVETMKTGQYYDRCMEVFKIYIPIFLAMFGVNTESPESLAKTIVDMFREYFTPTRKPCDPFADTFNANVFNETYDYPTEPCATFNTYDPYTCPLDDLKSTGRQTSVQKTGRKMRRHNKHKLSKKFQRKYKVVKQTDHISKDWFTTASPYASFVNSYASTVPCEWTTKGSVDNDFDFPTIVRTQTTVNLPTDYYTTATGIVVSTLPGVPIAPQM